MQPLIVSNILFPLHEMLFGRKTFVFLKELEKSQWLSKEELECYQLNKLRKLLLHCYQNIPYYRQLFTCLNFYPEKFTNLEQFSVLPTINKKIIRENFKALKTQNLNSSLVKMSTGGSTGEPLTFFVDKDRVSYDKALRLRDRRWWGIGAGDYEAIFWGSPIELSKQDKLKRMRDFLFNSRLFSAFNMTDKTMSEYASQIISYRPRHIFGYSSAIYLFAQFARSNKIDLVNCKVKVIFTTGEVLYDFQRETIQNVFGCQVANEYGARDVGFIAQECPQGSLHISENIIAENNSQDELIFTNLDSYGMPFIRYHSGDKGKVVDSSCPCGRKLKVLEKIEGRANDMLLTTEGKTVHPAVMNHIFRNIKGITGFQIIQKEKDYLVVNIVHNGTFTKDIEEMIRSKINEHMGSARIKINQVDKIIPDKSGKFRYVINES